MRYSQAGAGVPTCIFRYKRRGAGICALILALCQCQLHTFCLANRSVGAHNKAVGDTGKGNQAQHSHGEQYLSGVAAYSLSFSQDEELHMSPQTRSRKKFVRVTRPRLLCTSNSPRRQIFYSSEQLSFMVSTSR